MKPFTPEDLPLSSFNWDDVIKQTGEANRALARFDGLLYSLPNPALLLSPLTMQEAVLSSKIEGTQATFEEVLQFEANAGAEPERMPDIQEVINYRKALAFAVDAMRQKPINLNMLKATHEILLDGVRDVNKSKGRFRTIQNWIGSAGADMNSARFVPPEPEAVLPAMRNLEKYIHFEEKDVLVQLALIHAQFEIIHPFLDGNGRMGRILVPLFLYQAGILKEPMFYISAFLEQNRTTYYDQLKRITDTGNWTDWVNFFLNAIREQAEINTSKAHRIHTLQDEVKGIILDLTKSQYALNCLDFIFQYPVFSSTQFKQKSGIPPATSARILKQLTAGKVVRITRISSGQKAAVYGFERLLEIVNE